MFKNKKLTTSSLIDYVTTKGREWAKAWTNAKLQIDFKPPLPRTEALIGWKPPASGWMKLNTDGAARMNSGVATTGGILRNSFGDWRGGF
ncbi:unnamed protein product [Linum trigynum]|uniref:RNase H type-1 domain-containing protein n=1 Tax=Linum trigynum TaxID=586398 RepID=A0AAV2GS44_9ROSI